MNKYILWAGLFTICVSIAFPIIWIIYNVQNIEPYTQVVGGELVIAVHVGGWSIGLLLTMFSGYFENGEIEKVKLGRPPKKGVEK